MMSSRPAPASSIGWRRRREHDGRGNTVIVATPRTKTRLRFGVGVARRALAVLRSRLRPIPPRTTGPDAAPAANGMFSAERAASLRAERLALERFDLYLHDVMNSPRLIGQIVFEYGTLLRAVTGWSALRVLDIGTGRSTLPRWMSGAGAVVTTFDLAAPAEPAHRGFQERVNRFVARRAGTMHAVLGSMRDLPFADSTFDLLTSLSVVEHLDTDLPARTFVPYPEQQRRLARVLDEMIRVARPGGLIYVTSECCDYQRATTDRWKPAYYHDGGPALSGAWPVDDVPDLFYGYVAARGCTLVGGVQFAAADIARPECWTWRGPFFSGFSMLARKS
jgi:SAM-dependent methyltransferase